MTPIQKTLLAIALFVAVALGGFIYFVSNWSSATATSLNVPENFRGLGLSPGLPLQPGQHT